MNDAAGPGYKLNRKVKLAVGKAKTTKNGFKSEGRKKKPSETEMERPSRNYKIDGAVLVKEKNRERRNYGSGVKDKRRHLGQEGYKGNIDEKLQRGQASLDWKRKRIYADQDINKEGFLRKEEAPNRKFLSRDKNDSFNSQRDTKRKSREVETSNGGVSSVRRGNSYKDKVIDGRRKSKAVQLPKDNDTLYVRDCSRSNVNRNRSSGMSDYKLKTKEKAEDRQVSTSLDESLDGLHKKQGKGKSDSTINVNQRQNRHQFLDKTTKKVVRYKKILDGESVETDMPPKKKKRVIRIDPHDISNKRLDDGISNIESTVKGKADPEEQTELSKNAQFRAIQPSPSILSFVEDNLLGRRRLIELRRSGYNIELSAPLDNVPFSTSSERERIEESAFRNKLNFFAAAKVSSSFPPADRPEIAFAGRSNVGKSSLLNALTRQWGVVRTSDKPGLTQTINFFELGTKLCLVDLPGYGFAYAKEEVKESWEELVKEYVSTRVGLKRVCLLIDTKWGMKPRDHELISLMERSQTKYQIVLTKTDVVFPLDVARRAMEIEEKLRAHKSLIQPVMMVSSKTGAGIQCLRTVLAKVARFVKV